jgi:molecular chaperone DnaJ
MWLQLRNQGEPGDPGPRGEPPHPDPGPQAPVLRTQSQRPDLPGAHQLPAGRPGADIEVPTLDGPERLHVPKGTQSGDVLRIKGRGMPDINGRSPRRRAHRGLRRDAAPPLRRQEELLRELAEIEHGDVSPKRKSFFEKLRDYFTEEAEANDPDAS